MITPTDVEKFDVFTLKNELKQRSLPTKGRKAELKKRLLSTIQSDENVNSIIIPSSHSETHQEDCEVSDIFMKSSQFEHFLNEYEAFKRFITNKLSATNDFIQNFKSKNEKDLQTECESLREENRVLKQQLKTKEEIIELLSEDLNTQKRGSGYEVDLNTQNDVRNYNHPMIQTPEHPIHIQNRFEHLKDYPANSVEVDLGAGKKHRQRRSNRSTNEVNTSIQRNGFVIDQHPERNFHPNIPQVPGINTYAEVVSERRNKVVIFGDSMVKRMKTNEVNGRVRTSKSIIKSFPGARSDEMKYYTIPTIDKFKPNTVLIHVGTNDVKRTDGGDNRIRFIAEDIVNVARACRMKGVKNIIVSGIICRRNQYENNIVNEVNQQVKTICDMENFVFLDNTCITPDLLWNGDGLHLTDDGTKCLTNHFINFLNNYNF